MSTTGPLVVNEVWRILQDTELEHVVKEDGIRQAVVRQGALVAKLIGVGETWVSAAITTATATRDYTLSTASEYAAVLALRYASDKRTLGKVSYDTIVRAQSGDQAASGRQYRYALSPDAAMGIVVSFPGYPSAVEAIDARVSLVPTTWPQGAGTPPTIPFSTTAVRAVELLTAAAIFDTLGDDKLTQLDLNPKVAASWRAEGMRLAKEEQLTIIRLKRAQGVDLSYDALCAWGAS